MNFNNPSNNDQFGFNSYPPMRNSMNNANIPPVSLLPTPVGNAYSINNSYEIANIPAGVGTSAALCMNEGILYLKSMQNGSPVVVGYKIMPLTAQNEENKTPAQPNADETYASANDLKFYDKKLKFVEDEIKALKEKVGGLSECQF